MARQAFLILVHGQPEQFARLVRALDFDSFDVFVHVDRSVDITPFVSGVDDRVEFASRRFDVERKCWSMVQATRELLEMATSRRSGYEYLTLLSGADYPLASAPELAERLESGSTELVHYFRIDDRRSWEGRVNRRRYRDDAYAQSSPRAGSLLQQIDLAGRRSRRVYHRSLGVLGREFYPPDDWTLCGGSQWWSISDAAARYCLAQLSRRTVRNYFRFTDGPDELVFQTLLYNSSFRDRLAAGEAYRIWSEGPKEARLPEVVFNGRYIDWGVERHENPSDGAAARGPAVLDKRDFDELAASGAMFARKCDMLRSSELLDRIDKELRSG